MANSFSWEREYKRTWLNDSKKELKNELNSYKRYYNDKKKGVLRHLHILIDVSESIDRNDYLPSIRKNVINSLEKFVSLFLLENPISGLSFSCVNDKVKKLKSDLDVRNFLNQKGEGEFSLLNGLYSAFEQIKSQNFCKEILVIVSSLVLKDSDPYTEIIELSRKHDIKINILSFRGELMIFRYIVESTGGKLYIPRNLDHFNDILERLTIPTEMKSSTINLIKLGFPKLINEEGICACHLELHSVGYECPVCKTFICSLPMGCPICDHQLVSSINIAKSFQHIYPLESFITCKEGPCIVCDNLAEKCCSKCEHRYCNNCDFYIHDNLNFCLTCTK